MSGQARGSNSVADRRCPACGAPAPGRFCAQCGAPAGGTPESRRGVPPAIWAAGGFGGARCAAPARVRFGPNGGAPAGGPPESRRGVPPAIWAAGGFVVLALVVLIWTARQQRAPAPLARAAAAEAPVAAR